MPEPNQQEGWTQGSDYPEHLKQYLIPVDYFAKMQDKKGEAEFERLRRMGFEPLLRERLIEIGVPPRAVRASWKDVPDTIRNMGTVEEFPFQAFGLVGPGGCGKSCAMSASIKRTIVALLEYSGPMALKSKGGPVFKWINWPSFSVTMKQLASRRAWDNPSSSLIPVIDWIMESPERHILVVDDIGSESVKGEKSYVQEQLELLVDTVYNHEAKMFWTSNVRVEQLADPKFYGYRFVSRLTGASPDIELPQDLPDLRIMGEK